MRCSAGPTPSATTWSSAPRPTTARARLSAGRQGLPGLPAPADVATSTPSPAPSARPASGYYGFATRFSPDVTLEEDLARRDLTINAMARTRTDGEVIDPYGGRADLAARVLRHVSPAFVEDPLRVLRVARFAARFAPLGFRVAPETLALMREIVRAGEMQALVPERVWVETERALGEAQPDASISRCCAIAGRWLRCFPEVDRLWGVPQPETVASGDRHGRAHDAGAGGRGELSTDTAVRFAALVHDLGKGVTPAGAVAAPYRPRAGRGASDRATVRTNQGAERASRTGQARRRANTSASTAQHETARRDDPRSAGGVRRIPPPRSLRKVAAGLRGRRPRSRPGFAAASLCRRRTSCAAASRQPRGQTAAGGAAAVRRAGDRATACGRTRRGDRAARLR